MKRRRDYQEEKEEEDRENKRLHTSNLLQSLGISSPEEDDDEESKEEKKEPEEERPIYQRLFENPPRRIFSQPRRFEMNREQKEAYTEALPDFSEFNLLDLIFQHTVAKEIGTPVESCYTSTTSGSNTLTCAMNFSRMRAAQRELGIVSFKDHQCAIYCLLKNLPTSYRYRSCTYGKKCEDAIAPFRMRVEIEDPSILINVEYDQATRDYLILLSLNIGGEEKKNERYQIPSIDDLIDLIFYYGSKTLVSSFIENPHFGKILNFIYPTSSIYNFWDAFLPKEIVFQTFPE
jgi:hypothetical protein